MATQFQPQSRSAHTKTCDIQTTFVKSHIPYFPVLLYHAHATTVTRCTSESSCIGVCLGLRFVRSLSHTVLGFPRLPNLLQSIVKFMAPDMIHTLFVLVPDADGIYFMNAVDALKHLARFCVMLLCVCGCVRVS